MFQQELTINPPSHQPDAANVTEIQAQKPPTSPRELAAARTSGAKSHSPKTPAVRAKCASAAAPQIIHGLLAQTIIVSGESEPRFRALLTRLSAKCRGTRRQTHAKFRRVPIP